MQSGDDNNNRSFLTLNIIKNILSLSLSQIRCQRVADIPSLARAQSSPKPIN